MKKFRIIIILLAILFFVIPQLGLAEEEVKRLEEIRVTAPGKKDQIMITPSTTVIEVEKYKKPGTITNIVDILKDQAIIDFRGQTDLVPGTDSIYMRGFETRRFVVAIDSLPFDKSLSWGQVVDYAQIPLGQIERIEILPGSHSALYTGKSIGGVVNVITKTPKRYTTIKPDVEVANSYGSYETHNHSIIADGGIESFVYALSAQAYRTDGYLRHTGADIDNYACMLGYVFPADGYISLTGSYTEQDFEQAVKNDPARSDYRSHYPVWAGGSGKKRGYESWQDPTTDKEAYSLRLNYKQPTPIGLWTLRAYYTQEDHGFKRHQYINPKNKAKGTYFWTSPNSDKDQRGLRIQDEVILFKSHTLTFGFDTAQFWENFKPRMDDHYKIRDTKAGYIQDKWKITPRLTLTAGLRYEDVDLKINNYSEARGWGSNKGYQITTTPLKKYIKKDWNQLLPKSFLTYELDDVSDMLRDTSVSIGISKIWNVAPFCLV